MTPLQRKWEDILASHGLPAEDGGDTALNRAMFFGNPDNFEEEGDDFSTFMDTIEEPNPWVLERPPLILPVRTVTPEELKAMDGGGCVMWTFTDQRTKHDRYRYSSEVQAARFRDKHHPEKVKQKMRATALRIWADPERRAARAAKRKLTGWKKCEPGCTCSKHRDRKGLGKGKKHNVSPEGLWRQDVARRRRTKGQMFLPLSFS